MIYRPSPRLVAANAALVQFLRQQDVKASSEPLRETAANESGAARATEESGQREEELDGASRGQARHGEPDARGRQTGDKGK